MQLDSLEEDRKEAGQAVHYSGRLTGGLREQLVASVCSRVDSEINLASKFHERKIGYFKFFKRKRLICCLCNLTCKNWMPVSFDSFEGKKREK